MAKLKFVKNIMNEHVINSFQLIVNSIFGGKLPEIYDENKVYNKGDYVVVVENNKYVVKCVVNDNTTGPFNPENFNEMIFSEIFQENNTLVQNINIIKNNQEAATDDIATLVYELAGLIDSRLTMNILYRENFKNSDKLKITIGLHVPGCIQSIPGKGIDFKLSDPIKLNIQPIKFKLKHHTVLQGLTTLGCSITFNALDTKPVWFTANDAILSSDFFEIPEFEKDENVPYALDIRIHGDCTSDSSIKISDLMVVFL